MTGRTGAGRIAGTSSRRVAVLAVPNLQSCVEAEVFGRAVE